MKSPSIGMAAVIVGWLTGTPPANAESIQTIDCARDRLPAERTICASQHLQILDAKITEHYADIMLDQKAPRWVKAALYETQLRFLDRRNACGANVGCLDAVMSRRLSHVADSR